MKVKLPLRDIEMLCASYRLLYWERNDLELTAMDFPGEAIADAIAKLDEAMAEITTCLGWTPEA